MEIKRRDTDPASNQFLSVLHHLEHTKRFTELGREEKGEGGDRDDLLEKKENPEGETNLNPQFPVNSWDLQKLPLSYTGG